MFAPMRRRTPRTDHNAHRRRLRRARLRLLPAIQPLEPRQLLASNVQVNPTGGGFGSGQAGDVINVGSFTYDLGNALYQDGNPAVSRIERVLNWNL
jgi:hypothetical protein